MSYKYQLHASAHNHIGLINTPSSDKYLSQIVGELNGIAIEYLVRRLPRQLGAFVQFKPSQTSHFTASDSADIIIRDDSEQVVEITTLASDRTDAIVDLMKCYAQLPFLWLRRVIEDELPLGEFEKYQFAKRVIEQRRIRGESVQIVFGDSGVSPGSGNGGGRVSVTCRK